MRFKRGLRFDGPVSFCSLSSGQNPGWMHQGDRLPKIEAPGFLGYVVELIELRPQEEHLRFTALLWCYANLCVFTTEAEAIAANEARIRENPETGSLRYVALDLLDTPGFDLSHWCRTGEFTLPNGTIVVSKCHVSFGDFRPHVYCPWGSSASTPSVGTTSNGNGTNTSSTGARWSGSWIGGWNGVAQARRADSGEAMRLTERLMRKRDHLKAMLLKFAQDSK
jgi:hypothetical protein